MSQALVRAQATSDIAYELVHLGTVTCTLQCCGCHTGMLRWVHLDVFQSQLEALIPSCICFVHVVSTMKPKIRYVYITDIIFATQEDCLLQTIVLMTLLELLHVKGVTAECPHKLREHRQQQ